MTKSKTVHKHTPPDIHGSVKVGPQGQVVIPAKLRKLLKIKTGDSLIVFTKIPHIISMMSEHDASKMITMFEQHLKEHEKTVKKLKKITKK